MKKILITGGTGFIGSAISNHFCKKGYKITILDNNSRGNLRRINKNKEKIKFIYGDITKYNDVCKAAKGQNYIFHLAAVNGTKYFYEKPDKVLDVSCKGIINVIDAAKKLKIKNIFLASSSEVYHLPNKIPTDEFESIKIPDIFNPRYSYAGGKILTELMGINNAKFFNKMIIFRPHNVYGKDMGQEHVIPELITKVRNARTNIKIKGSGLQTRSFIYIDDFVEAFYLIFKKGKHLNIYNIGTQEQIKIIELTKLIIKIFAKKISIKKKQIAIGGTQHRMPNISKIKKLGFKKRFNIIQGLKKIIQ
jgi:nucleoside-diphosphate-sugar epimerase